MRNPDSPNPGDQVLQSGSLLSEDGTSRRKFIATLALGCAALLSATAVAGDLLTARQPGGPVRKGQALSKKQMRLLRDFVETIIPETETPGAAATDAHGFIDDQLAHCQQPEEARRFIEGLNTAGAVVEQHWNAAYSDLTTQDQRLVMKAIASHDKPFEALAGDFFQNLKSLTLLAYYSSEAGASEELVYLPIPGGYDGNFKVSDNGGKAFSPLLF